MRAQVTTSRFAIAIAADVPVGTCVWVCAVYYNQRGECGPGSNIVCTVLGAGVSMQRMAA